MHLLSHRLFRNWASRENTSRATMQRPHNIQAADCDPVHGQALPPASALRRKEEGEDEEIKGES